jgi:hypothetical protein
MTPFNSDIVRIRPDGTDKKILMDDNLSNAVPILPPMTKESIFIHWGWVLPFPSPVVMQ